MQPRKRFFPSSLAPLRSIHGTLVRRFGTPTTTQLGIFLNPQTRSFSSVSPTVAVTSPTPAAFPPPITESALLQAIQYSKRHFIEHLSPHLTPSILPSVQASFDLTTRCLAFCTLYRLSYPQHSVHHLLHPLILTAANPESILDELARARECLNVDSTSVFDALIKGYCELKMPDEALKCFYLMKEKGFLPQIETCNQMLKLFLKLNRNHAKEFIGHMETIGEKFEVACLMFQTMKDTGLFKDAYGNESESGLVPHALTYNALIHNWCKIGVVECYRKQNTEDLELGRLPASTGVASLLGRQGRSSSLCLRRKFSTSQENVKRYGKMFPGSLNWRSITGVKLKDQTSHPSHRESCAVHTISTVLEINHKLETDESTELSVDSFAKEFPNGAQLYDVLDFTVQHGLEYTDDPVNFGRGRVFQIKGHKAKFLKPNGAVLTFTNPRSKGEHLMRFDHMDVEIQPDDDWLFQLVRKHAVAASLCFPSKEAFQYTGGVFEADLPCKTEASQHAMAIIGYEGHCWRLQNSHGPTWGIDGEMLMSRNTMMKLLDYVAYPTT